MRILKWLKWLGFVVLVLGTLLLLAVAFENYRGKRAWLAFKTEWEAKGERFDLEAFRPPTVPDEQNFAMTPLLASLHDYQFDPKTKQAIWRDTNAYERPQHLFGWRQHLRSERGWRTAEFVDLTSWQRELRGETNSRDAQIQALRATPLGKPEADLLFLLKLNAAELDEVRAASQRPYAVFKIHVEESFRALLPELAVMKNFASTFQVKALAELAAGNPDAAFADTQAALAMGEAVRSEPILIGGLVRIACLDIAMPPLYEGLARGQWSAAQLEQFQARLGRMNLVEEMLHNLRGERAFSIAVIDLMKHDPEALDVPGEEGLGTGALRYMPSGWFYQNQLNLARLYQETYLCFDPTRRTVDLALADQNTKDLEAQLRGMNPYRIFAKMLFPALHKAAWKTACVQATVNLATLACALERHRLSAGQYPDHLVALTPRFLEHLPADPVNGEPMKYRRTDDGRFLLYSVGLNRKDDGGTIALDKKGKPAPVGLEGDWVWRYPAK
jgi:hypothetical protein